jgi:hypothetical protein
MFIPAIRTSVFAIPFTHGSPACCRSSNSSNCFKTGAQGILHPRFRTSHSSHILRMFITNSITSNRFMVRLPAAGVLPILHPVCIIHTILHHSNARICPQVLGRDGLEIQHTFRVFRSAPYPARSGHCFVRHKEEVHHI